jgi:hypothetical protein
MDAMMGFAAGDGGGDLGAAAALAIGIGLRTSSKGWRLRRRSGAAA